MGGEQDAFWDGTDDHAIGVASGIYYYSLETGSGDKLVNKMVYVSH
jgi:hypothetical protein